jgi:hypothetical protein
MDSNGCFASDVIEIVSLDHRERGASDALRIKLGSTTLDELPSASFAT